MGVGWGDKTEKVFDLLNSFRLSSEPGRPMDLLAYDTGIYTNYGFIIYT